MDVGSIPIGFVRFSIRMGWKWVGIDGKGYTNTTYISEFRLHILAGRIFQKKAAVDAAREPRSSNPWTPFKLANPARGHVDQARIPEDQARGPVDKYAKIGPKYCQSVDFGSIPIAFVRFWVRMRWKWVGVDGKGYANTTYISEFHSHIPAGRIFQKKGLPAAAESRPPPPDSPFVQLLTSIPHGGRLFPCLFGWITAVLCEPKFNRPRVSLYGFWTDSNRVTNS